MVFTALLLAASWAQEITPEYYQARIVDGRYQITYAVPEDDTDWNAYYDVFVFAKVPGTMDWFKARALAGGYQNVKSGTSKTVLWEPLLDYRKLVRYEFKLYAVNKKFVHKEYAYSSTEQIGRLTAYSDLQNVSYRISGEDASFRLPVALPAGDYWVEAYANGTRRNLSLVNIKNILLEVDLTPGTLTLSAKQAGVTYEIEGKEYSSVQRLSLPSGEYEVIAILDNPASGLLTQVQKLQVENGKPTAWEFDFQMGTLTLDAKQPGVRFLINDKEYSSVQDLALPVGKYTVQAVLDNAVTGPETRAQQVSIAHLQPTSHSFDFHPGSLSLTSNRSDAVYTINGKKLTEPYLLLPHGKYSVSASLQTDEPMLRGYAQTDTVTVQADKPSTLDFIFQLGSLTLSSSENGAEYRFLDEKVNSWIAQNSHQPQTMPDPKDFKDLGVFNGHHYYRSLKQMTWSAAKSICEAHGGHLVTLGSAEENNFLYQNVTAQTWIGFTDEAEEGKWVWVTGEPVTYTNWAYGEPNNQGNEDFGDISYSSNGPKWNDSQGGTNALYVVMEFESASYKSSTMALESSDGQNFTSVSNVTLPAGDYRISATLPAALTGSLDLSQTATVRVLPDTLNTHRFEFQFARLTLKTKLKNVNYEVDKVPFAQVKNLKLLAGEHALAAFAPDPYDPWFSQVLLQPGINEPITVTFKKNKQLVAAERRRQFSLHYINQPFGDIELNQYFDFDADDDSGYNPLRKGVSISGLQFRGLNVAMRDLDKPVAGSYPAFLFGVSVVDKVVITKEETSGTTRTMVDWFSANVGLAHLSKGGKFFGQLNLVGSASSQNPLVDKIDNYTYVSGFSETEEGQVYRKFDFNFGADLRYELGWRLWKLTYLHFNLGARYQTPMGGGWYENSDINAWVNNMIHEEPDPVEGQGLPKHNAAFDGLSFYAGVGLVNNILPPIFNAIFKFK